jgi:hypothetical protein
MFRIVEKPLDLQFPRGHHQHVMLCQIPNQLGSGESACRLADPDSKWQDVRSVLELVAQGTGNLKKLHFLIFPESAMPAAHVEEALGLIRDSFRPNTVTMFGVEHTPLSEYRAILERYRQDNAEALTSVLEDLDAGDIERSPANWAVVAVKEASGRLRVHLMAKSHPFVGEETLDPFHDLYRGKIFPLFRCTPNGFNFMALICLDYVYRDLYQSNISVIIDKANDLFFQTRQRLDLLAVLECNPKPEHKAFRDVINGFYGEYLAYTPGVRDSVTLFCNSSEESSGIAAQGETTFGRSSVIIHNSHKIAPADLPEFSSDDFGGLPVCRLRFGTATRLYYFNLPLFHELDPRTTRVPLKIHSIFRPTGKGGWQRLEGETEKDFVPDRA